MASHHQPNVRPVGWHRSSLEPEALLRASDAEVVAQSEVGSAEIQLSTAISLKRIADVLASAAGPAWLNGLSNIAWEAGRAFEAGRRQ